MQFKDLMCNYIKLLTASFRKVLDQLHHDETFKLGCIPAKQKQLGHFGDAWQCFGRLHVSLAGTAYNTLMIVSSKSRVNSTCFTCVVNKNVLASKMKQNASVTGTDLSC